MRVHDVREKLNCVQTSSRNNLLDSDLTREEKERIQKLNYLRKAKKSFVKQKGKV